MPCNTRKSSKVTDKRRGESVVMVDHHDDAKLAVPEAKSEEKEP